MADYSIDCVLAQPAGNNGMPNNRTVSTSTRCIICRERFENGDAILRVRNHIKVTDDCMHRRHVDEILAAGPVDEQRAIDEFAEYRTRLLQELTTR